MAETLDIGKGNTMINYHTVDANKSKTKLLSQHRYLDRSKKLRQPKVKRLESESVDSTFQQYTLKQAQTKDITRKQSWRVLKPQRSTKVLIMLPHAHHPTSPTPSFDHFDS